MRTKILNIQDRVYRLLLEQPETRDNDKLLVLKVWAEQFPEIRNPQVSVREFTQRFLNNGLADTESIRRSRQKLQELNPMLRGKSYRSRKREEEEMRQLMR